MSTLKRALFRCILFDTENEVLLKNEIIPADDELDAKESLEVGKIIKEKSLNKRKVLWICEKIENSEWTVEEEVPVKLVGGCKGYKLIKEEKD